MECGELSGDEKHRFLDIVIIETPVLAFTIQSQRVHVQNLRTLPMTEENLATLEKETENLCKFYMVSKNWKDIVKNPQLFSDGGR